MKKQEKQTTNDTGKVTEKASSVYRNELSLISKELQAQDGRPDANTLTDVYSNMKNSAFAAYAMFSASIDFRDKEQIAGIRKGCAELCADTIKAMQYLENMGK